VALDESPAVQCPGRDRPDRSRDLALTVKSSNGKSLVATEHYAFKASYGGDAGCQNTAQALMPAIQNVVGKAVRDPAFPQLLK
jgi:hypothetical protein